MQTTCILMLSYLYCIGVETANRSRRFHYNKFVSIMGYCITIFLQYHFYYYYHCTTYHIIYYYRYYYFDFSTLSFFSVCPILCMCMSLCVRFTRMPSILFLLANKKIVGCARKSSHRCCRFVCIFVALCGVWCPQQCRLWQYSELTKSKISNLYWCGTTWFAVCTSHMWSFFFLVSHAYTRNSCAYVLTWCKNLWWDK